MGDDWIQTYTGKRFFPLDPRPEDIDPVDIAHALSMLCRFGGHCSRFYSVAEHSVLMAKHGGTTHHERLWLLLHDAAEAYLVDVPRPIKRQLPVYQAAEVKLLQAIAARFELPYSRSDRVYPEYVHEIDNRILLTERRELMVDGVHRWAIDDWDPLPVTIHGWDWGVAESVFRDQLHALGVNW